MQPAKQPEYSSPSIIIPFKTGSTRHNWFDSTDVSFKEGKAKGHRHPNGGGKDMKGGYVADTAFVADTVVVKENAKVSGNALVFGTVTLEDNVEIYGNAVVFGSGTLGDGSNPLYVFESAVVFGNVTTSAGPNDVYSSSRATGRVYGEVVFGATTSVTGGDDAGDVFGEYQLTTGTKYQDVEYPTGPQIHVSEPLKVKQSSAGDSPNPIVSLTGLTGSVADLGSNFIAEATSLVADGVSDIFEIAVSVTEFTGEVTDLLVTVDGIVQQAGEAYSLLDNASSAVSELSEAKNKLIQFADTALPTEGAVVEFTKQPAVFVNDVLLEPVTDFTYDKATNQITNLVDGVPTNFEATDVIDIFNIPPFG
jgi:hypothetical protein